MKKRVRKQISFDLDSNVLKAMFGEKDYVRGWHDIQKFFEKNGFEHIQGSVYVSKKEMSYQKVLRIIQELKDKYPYLTKAVRKISQANISISEEYSLEDKFEYDGTPGEFAKEKNENTPTEQEQYGFDEDQLRQDAAELLEEAALTQSSKLTL